MAELKKAIFAGGCFWCIQPQYAHVDGVVETTVGYTGGHLDSPTYEQVCTDETGHYEAIEITYDPDKVSYEKLLELFWENIDPFDAGGQNEDRGQHYQTVIFPIDAQQRVAAETSKHILQGHENMSNPSAPRPVATKILEATPFYPAEAHHQDYYLKTGVLDGEFRAKRAAELAHVWQFLPSPAALEAEAAIAAGTVKDETYNYGLSQAQLYPNSTLVGQHTERHLRVIAERDPAKAASPEEAAAIRQTRQILKDSEKAWAKWFKDNGIEPPKSDKPVQIG